MRGLASKVVVVTGGGGGIGGATCRRFAAEGARVAVFDVNEKTAAKVADEISADGGTAEALACDITDYAAVQRAVAAAEAALGPIEVLVNNAGWDVFKPFTKTEPAEWEKLIAINLTGPLNMHHAVLPGMVARRKVPGRPTPTCSPATSRAPPIPRSSKRHSAARCRSAASASRRICPARYCSSQATTRPTSPDRC